MLGTSKRHNVHNVYNVDNVYTGWGAIIFTLVFQGPFYQGCLGCSGIPSFLDMLYKYYTANLSVVIFTAFSHVKFSAVLELYFWWLPLGTSDRCKTPLIHLTSCTFHYWEFPTVNRCSEISRLLVGNIYNFLLYNWQENNWLKFCLKFIWTHANFCDINWLVP